MQARAGAEGAELGGVIALTCVPCGGTIAFDCKLQKPADRRVLEKR